MFNFGKKKEGKTFLSKKVTLSKVQRISLTVATIIILSAFVISLINFLGKNNKQLKEDENLFLSPELARAMTYNLFDNYDVYEVDDNGNMTENVVDSVKFGAFFLRRNAQGIAEPVVGTCKEVGKQDTLYMELNVLSDGVLKDAKVTIDGKNFYLKTILPKDSEIKENTISENTEEILFNTIANGTQKMFYTTVRSGDYSYDFSKYDAIGTTNTNNYSRSDNKVIFSGIYEISTEDGTIEVPIKKEIPLTVDWYGKTATIIRGTILSYENLDNCIDRENERLNLSFTVTTEETVKQLMLSKNQLEVTIPKLNGYAPIEVSTTKDVFSYNAETGKIIINKNAIKDADGIIISGLSQLNSFKINVVYPIEAYDANETENIRLEIPVQEYYEGYNNPNSEFSNPYKSNIASATLNISYKKYVAPTQAPSIYVNVGRYVYDPYRSYIISKQKPLRFYNELSSEEKDDTYQVYWNVQTGTNPSGEKIVLRETNVAPTVTEIAELEQQGDKFIKTDNSFDSMENITINKSISFSNIQGILNENGVIKVYDDSTGILLLEINNDNIKNYLNNQKFSFETPVKHVRVEIEGYKNNSILEIYFTKELDDSYITDEERGYIREEFDNLKYIRSYLVGYMGETQIGNKSNTALYVEPSSIATINLSKPAISTQTTEKNEIITISAEYNASNNQIGWTNGDFLVKLPEEIIAVELNGVTVDNNAVKITNSEIIENEAGRFIKINTSNKNPISFNISIDVDITADPRVDSRQKDVILYASNNEGTTYYYQDTDIYDVNNNLSTEDPINKTSTKIDLVSPNSLLTNSTVSEFDDAGTVIVSPQVADIKPAYVNVDNEELSAKIGVQIKNNYSDAISDLVIVGKIPFEGNKYAITGRELGSTFSTTMKDTGIIIPAGLDGLVDVYYSTNENATKDINLESNNWVKAEDVEDWSQVKTFLIDFKDIEINPGQEYLFTYEVIIPDGLNFNEVSFAHHGAYFALNTEEGKYITKTEPNKVGLRIAEKYNLEINKFQTGKENKISGATYVITEIYEVDGEEKEGNSKSAMTDENGSIRIDDLYADIMYEIKEIKTPDDYELNNDVIRFIGHANNRTGELTFEKISGTIKNNEITVTKNEGERYLAKIDVEDEAKARLKIIKENDEINELLKGVRFKITGEGLPEKGKSVTTSANGEATIKGLKIGEEYTLEEVKAEGYYLNAPIKFRINNNEGSYEVEITEDGTQETIEGEEGEDPTITTKIKEHVVTEENNLPIGKIKIGNEIIPTYNLVMTKIKHVTRTNMATNQEEAGTENNEDETTYIVGAKFKLYKDQKELGAYITDETGHLYINNLYQYVEEKDIDQTYILKEVFTPEGYSKIKDIKFKVQKENDKLKFVEELEEGQAAKEYSVEGNTININVEDNPSFKIIKKDGETGEALPNTKFAIYNLDNGVEFAKNSKGETLGEKEEIDGEEYYVLTTDQNGEITADLPEGLYKAIEIQASDIKYYLTNKEWYFGIGASKKTNSKFSTKNSITFGDSEDEMISKIEKTVDGGYICIGTTKSRAIELNETISFANTRRKRINN